MSFIYDDEGFSGGLPLGGYGTHRGAMNNPWIEFLKEHGHEGYSRAQLQQMYRGSSLKKGTKGYSKSVAGRKDYNKLRKTIKKEGAMKGRELATYKLLKKNTGKKASQLIKSKTLLAKIKKAIKEANKLTEAELIKLIHGGMEMGGFGFSDLFDIVKTVAPIVPLLL